MADQSTTRVTCVSKLPLCLPPSPGPFSGSPSPLRASVGRDRILGSTAPVLTQTQGGATTQTPSAQTPSAPKQPTYMVVEFMKVPEGKEDAWLKLERENWKPTQA